MNDELYSYILDYFDQGQKLSVGENGSRYLKTASTKMKEIRLGKKVAIATLNSETQHQ